MRGEGVAFSLDPGFLPGSFFEKRLPRLLKVVREDNYHCLIKSRGL
jgi:hypothetical protein